ncbi:MAG: molybdopterin converting factor, partial [Phycisphaerales bacterium]
MKPIRLAVITVSDRCSRGVTVDTTGPALLRLAEAQLAAQITA